MWQTRVPILRKRKRLRLIQDHLDSMIQVSTLIHPVRMNLCDYELFDEQCVSAGNSSLLHSDSLHRLLLIVLLLLRWLLRHLWLQEVDLGLDAGSLCAVDDDESIWRSVSESI